MSGADDSDLFARTLEFRLETAALVAETLRPIEEGWLIRTPALQQVWSGNQVLVTGATRFSDALALVERHLADLAYRHLVVEHQSSGKRLERLFREDGWKVERNVTMALTGSPDREIDTSVVVEVDPEDALELLARWSREDPELNLGEDDRRQIVEFSRRQWRARGARSLGILGDGGELVAMTSVFSDGQTAQVEDVYTVPEARRRGYARTLVTRAVALARDGGHELTFIDADDDDWPKQLYRRIGFEPVGLTWHFHRDVGG